MRALSYEIDVAARKVVITYRAQPTIAQWSETMEAIFAEVGDGPPVNFIFDRSLLSLPSDTDYIKEFVEFIDRRQASCGRSKWAIVTNDLGSFGMGRMAEQLSNFEGSIRVFKDYTQAARWVDG